MERSRWGQGTGLQKVRHTGYIDEPVIGRQIRSSKRGVAFMKLSGVAGAVWGSLSRDLDSDVGVRD